MKNLLVVPFTSRGCHNMMPLSVDVLAHTTSPCARAACICHVTTNSQHTRICRDLDRAADLAHAPSQLSSLLGVADIRECVAFYEGRRIFAPVTAPGFFRAKCGPFELKSSFRANFRSHRPRWLMSAGPFEVGLDLTAAGRWCCLRPRPPALFSSPPPSHRAL